MNYVYVLSPDGEPLMPTTRYGKVRRMLKSGQAVPVTTVPFTIRLAYFPQTSVCQQVTAGFDPGRTNIGISTVRQDGRCLYLARCETRNREIPKLMAKRKKHRQASRRGERLARKHLAKRLGTTMDGILERILPGCEKPLKVKDIINTESRFNNRLRPEGWLTPTAVQLQRTHVNLLKLVCQILPVTSVTVELNWFAFMQLDNPDIPKCEIDFQRGPLYETDGVKDAVSIQQGGKCLLCRKREIGHYHHIVPKSKRGSDTIANMAGLCLECHRLVHTSQETEDRLKKKKAGLDKKYGGTSVLNQALPSILAEFEKRFPGHTYATNGWNTRQFRDMHRLEKSHATDAYCIAASTLASPVIDLPDTCHEIVQYRRHDRTGIKRQTERTYYLGKKAVCKNRHKRFGQKTDSLEEFAARHPELVPELDVKKSKRSYNELGRILPGVVVFHEGKRYILSGLSSGGTWDTVPYAWIWGKELYFIQMYGCAEKQRTGICKLASCKQVLISRKRLHPTGFYALFDNGTGITLFSQLF